MNESIILPLRAVLASTEMPLSSFRELGEGSVVELDSLAGEPVDIYLGNELYEQNLIARAEVVVVEDHFGVRIVEIVGEDTADE